MTESRATVRRPSLRVITLGAGPADVRAGSRSSVEQQRPARWPVRHRSTDLPPKPWNVSAILSPFVALVCAPVGLCLALIAAGRIGMGRQRGIGFAVAGIVIGSLIPILVCVGSIIR